MTELFAKILAIVEKWDKHIKPGSQWHASECCVDELVEELKDALGWKESEAKEAIGLNE